MKRCSKCGETKPVSEFNKDLSRKDGIFQWCKQCARENSLRFYHANRERYLAHQKIYRDNNREAKRAYDRKHSRRHDLSYRYGLTLDEYERRLSNQGGKCGICTVPLTRPNVDHDHTTGVIRGLLCTPCNQGVGFFRDSPVLLRAAADYIVSWPKKI